MDVRERDDSMAHGSLMLAALQNRPRPEGSGEVSPDVRGGGGGEVVQGSTINLTASDARGEVVEGGLDRRVGGGGGETIAIARANPSRPQTRRARRPVFVAFDSAGSAGLAAGARVRDALPLTEGGVHGFGRGEVVSKLCEYLSTRLDSSCLQGASFDFCSRA